MTRGHDFLIMSGSESDDTSAKKCHNCHLGRWEDQFVQCSECEEYYHICCVEPPGYKGKSKTWICADCIHCDGCGLKQKDLGLGEYLEVRQLIGWRVINTVSLLTFSWLGLTPLS